MKRTFLLKMMLLLCALVAGSSSVWADVDSYTAISNDKPTAKNGTTTGTVTGTNSISWSYSVTQETKSGKSPYIAFSDDNGWQLGSSNSPCTAFSISTSGISGTITKIEVEVGSYNASSRLNCTVGGSAFGTQNQNTGNGAVSKITFEGSAFGEIIVSATASTRAFYFKSVTVTYTKTNTPVTDISLNKTATTLTVGETEQLTAIITPVNASNKNVTWESDNESIATVDNDGIVTAVAKGIANITVTTEDGGFTATCTVTVKPVPPVSATLDFTSNDWGISVSPTKTVDATEFTSGDYTITLEGSSGNGYYFDSNNIMLGKSGAKLTLPAFSFNVSKIKVYGTGNASASVTFNIFVGDDAVSTDATSSQVDHEFAIADDKQDAGTIYIVKVTNANNMRISKIEIFGYMPISVGDYEWATINDANNVLDFSTIDAVKAYLVTGHSGSLLVKEEVTTNVPKNTGLLINAAKGSYNIPVVKNSSTDVSSNKLVAGTGAEVTKEEGKTKYVLSLDDNDNIAFMKINNDAATVPADKAYLEFNEVVSAPSFGFGDATAIDEVRSKTEDVRGDFYNLNGQRVANPTKGLYIVNGKKYIVK